MIFGLLLKAVNASIEEEKNNSERITKTSSDSNSILKKTFSTEYCITKSDNCIIKYNNELYHFD